MSDVIRVTQPSVCPWCRRLIAPGQVADVAIEGGPVHFRCLAALRHHAWQRRINTRQQLMRGQLLQSHPVEVKQ